MLGRLGISSAPTRQEWSVFFVGTSIAFARMLEAGMKEDPVKLITQDHRTVKSLFRRFEGADQNKEKQQIAEQIIEELSVHATIEEQLVYPILRRGLPRIEASVLNALEEHHAVKLTLLELDKMTVDDERFDAKMHVVREAVEMHIEEEETQLLPKLARLLDSEVSMALAQAIVAMKQAAPNHPHPAAPDTPPSGIVAGMFAKLSDVAKDVIRKISSPAKSRGHDRVRARAKSTAKRASQRKAAVARRRTTPRRRVSRSQTKRRAA
jgi:hemerythrin superfamily protein